MKTTNENFYKKLKGCKVNVVSRMGAESYVGLISNLFDDEWLEIIPFFVDKDLEDEVKKKFPGLTELRTVSATLYKRLSSVDTIIILKKPEITDESDNKNTKK